MRFVLVLSLTAVAVAPTVATTRDAFASSPKILDTQQIAALEKERASLHRPIAGSAASRNAVLVAAHVTAGLGG